MIGKYQLLVASCCFLAALYLPRVTSQEAENVTTEVSHEGGEGAGTSADSAVPTNLEASSAKTTVEEVHTDSPETHMPTREPSSPTSEVPLIHNVAVSNEAKPTVSSSTMISLLGTPQNGTAQPQDSIKKNPDNGNAPSSQAAASFALVIASIGALRLLSIY